MTRTVPEAFCRRVTRTVPEAFCRRATRAVPEAFRRGTVRRPSPRRAEREPRRRGDPPAGGGSALRGVAAIPGEKRSIDQPRPRMERPRPP